MASVEELLLEQIQSLENQADLASYAQNWDAGWFEAWYQSTCRLLNRAGRGEDEEDLRRIWTIYKANKSRGLRLESEARAVLQTLQVTRIELESELDEEFDESELGPQLRTPALKLIASLLTGAAGARFPQRTGKEVQEFFGSIGVWAPLIGEKASQTYLMTHMRELQGSSGLRTLIEDLVDRRLFQDDQAHREALELLNATLKYDGYELVPHGFSHRLTRSELVELGRIQTELLESSEMASFVEETILKIELRLSRNDFDGVVTAARSMLEAVLRDIEEQLTGARSDGAKGNLTRLYAKVAKLLHLTPTESGSNGLRSMISGLGTAVDGIAAARNRLGDSHARALALEHHHARLVASGAATIAQFLLASLAARLESDQTSEDISG